MFRLSDADKRVWLVIGTITIIGILFIPFSQMVLDVSYNYTLRTVALGGAILGIVSGVLGCFAVLRHESLMGDALSHAALPGVAIAFLLAGRELGALLIGAGIASWIGVQFIRTLLNTTRIKQDTAMGIVSGGMVCRQELPCSLIFNPVPMRVRRVLIPSFSDRQRRLLPAMCN